MALGRAQLKLERLDMTMYYAHSRKQQRLEAQGRVLEAVLPANRGCNGRRRFSSKIVDQKLVYNEELTASSGRLTQR
jgi:hypothetical protein